MAQYLPLRRSPSKPLRDPLSRAAGAAAVRVRSLQLQLAREVVVVSQGQVGLVHQFVEHHAVDQLPLAVEQLLQVGVLLKLRDDLVPGLELGVEDLLRGAVNSEAMLMQNGRAAGRERGGKKVKRW